MNTPPRYSHSRQGSVDASGAAPTSSAPGVPHPYLSTVSGSKTPPHHNPLNPYAHPLASLAYQSPSFASIRHASGSAWSPVNPSGLGSTPIQSNPSQGSNSSKSASNKGRKDDSNKGRGNRKSQGNNDNPDDDDDDDDNDDDDDDDDDDDGDSSDSSDQDSDKDESKPTGSKRKRSASSQQDDKASKPSAGASNSNSANDPKRANPSETPAKKPKPTRGAKACTNCRRLKMRCVGAEKGPPCNRCRHGNHECIFEESNRGKKGGRNQKTEAMQQSLKKMEQTLATVLRSIRDPGLAAQTGGMVTRSPSPTYGSEEQKREQQQRHLRQTHSFASSWHRPEGFHPPGTQDLASPGGQTVNPSAFQAHPASASSQDGSASSPATHGTRFLEPLPHHRNSMLPPSPEPRSTPHTYERSRTSRGSPRLHSLPDNTLNPLGLLAEASLHNNHRAKRHGRASSTGSSAKDRESSKSASVSGQSPAKFVKAEGGDEDRTPSSAAGAAVNSGTASSAGKNLLKRKDSEAGPANEAERVPLGVASDTYFKPGPMTILPLRRIIIEREMPPELLTTGIVTSEEVLDLFRIFFSNCCQHLLLLDADWHTPTFICSRSPFLFTCICTVASKFYTRRPDLHQKCLSLVKKVAFDVMSRGFKSIEIVQGFLLLSMWNQPAERFEEDKTWLFSGIAIRMATDLNLHRKSVASFSGNPCPDDPAVLDREREILNRERTWYICFIVDRSISAQMGKPYTVREDWIVRNCRNWGSRFSRIWDIGISALVDLHRIHSRQLDFLYSSTTSVSGLNTEIDYSLVLPIFNEQLEEWRELWKWRGLSDLPPQAQAYLDRQRERQKRRREAAKAAAAGEPASVPAPEADKEEEEDELDHNTRIMVHVVKQAPFRFNYAVLVLNSFGLQQSLDHPRGGGLDRAQYFAKCMEAAKSIVTVARDDLREELRYATDAQFVSLAYACVFLLKLIRPVFSSYVYEESVIELVQDTVELLDEIAVNETHTPALYATFLKALLQARTEQTVGSKSGPNSRVHSRAASPGTAEAAPAAGNEEPQAGMDASLDPVFTLEPETWESSTAMGGMEDFWGSLLPPGFAQPSMQDLFGASDVLGQGVNQNANAHLQSKFGMGGGGAFDFASTAIANGNGGMPPVTPGPISGTNTPHGGRSRRSSATQLLSNLSNVTFDFTG